MRFCLALRSFGKATWIIPILLCPGVAGAYICDFSGVRMLGWRTSTDHTIHRVSITIRSLELVLDSDFHASHNLHLVARLLPDRLSQCLLVDLSGRESGSSIVGLVEP